LEEALHSLHASILFANQLPQSGHGTVPFHATGWQVSWSKDLETSYLVPEAHFRNDETDGSTTELWATKFGNPL
jgi:hypothetical protein